MSFASPGMLSVILSTHLLPLGLSNFVTTSLSCRIWTPRWYVFQVANNRARVSQYLGAVLGTGRGPKKLSGDYYIRLWDNGTQLEFGRKGVVLVSATPSPRIAPESFKYMAFSAPATNIRSCLK